MNFSKFFYLLFFVFWLLNAKAQSPCSTCTINISSNSSATFFLGANQTMCISNGATFTGAITSISSSSKICITDNAIFNGSINNIPAGAQIFIATGSQFNPTGLFNIGGIITNNGLVNISSYLTVNAALSIVNSGTFICNSGMNMNSSFNINNSGTINFNNGFQSGSSAVTTITNTGVFNLGGYTTMLPGSSINNTGTYAATAQQAYLGINITNTQGQFLFSGTSNTIGSNSVINNGAYLSLNSFTLSASNLSNANTGTVIFQSTFTLANNCNFINDGSTNFKNNYQLDNGSVLTNNGNIQMNNGNSYLNTNGIFTNNGYIYVNGQVTIGNTAIFKNYCTIVAFNGFTNGASSTQNYGNLIVPSNASPANSTIIFNASFYNASNARVQGINFTNNSATVSGSGSFHFSGVTTNHGTFGNNANPPINFFDASPTPSSPSGGMFDAGFGSTSNTSKNISVALSINARSTVCNNAVINQGINNECDTLYYYSVPTSIFKNGSFSNAINNATGNTYNSGVGTTYNFSDGAFISQMDYVATGSSACPRANITNNGNAFAIVTLGNGNTYNGTGTCNNANQIAFPGDAAFGVGYQPNFMYVAGNTLTGEEFLVYQQNLSGLIVGKSYTFYFYISNLREAANDGEDPIIRVRVGGTDGLPDGAVGFGPFLLDESTSHNSGLLGGWVRIAYNFTATATTLKIKITDAAFSAIGDEWALTAMGITECKINDNDGDGVNDRNDIDDDNDGVIDLNEYGCTSTSQINWATTGTPNVQTINGVTLTPIFRNSFGLTSTSAVMTNTHSGNASNDIRIVSNPDNKNQFTDLILSFNKKVTNVSFEINDIDARNNGANTWKDSVIVYPYKNGSPFTLKPSEYNLSSQVIAYQGNIFVSNQTNNNLALSSNNGRVNFTITDPVDSILIQVFDNNPNKKDADIYISRISFCELSDTDKDGILNYLDSDSDNDGITDVIENYGVDTDGDGKIDGLINITNGLSNKLNSSGLSEKDFDGDGIPNYLDLDSDADGIPDIIEAGSVDSNNNGMVDSFIDNNFNGLQDSLEGNAALIQSGVDNNNDGLADSWPKKNADNLGKPNVYDLDSDGDGLSDYEESGLRNVLEPSVAGNKTRALQSSGNANGWSNNVKAISSSILNIRNTDGVDPPDYLDIDSDNDGITDNVEAMATNSYIVSSDDDNDDDGLINAYDFLPNSFGGNSLTPYDYDSDGNPDYMDSDADGDGLPDRNEGDRNFKILSQVTIDASGDSDGDGLMDIFDTFNLINATQGNLFKNYSMSQMGTGGDYNGPTPSGSIVQLQKSWPIIDRDWRDLTILPIHITSLQVSYNMPFAHVKWTVKKEIQTDYYWLERSTDGINFQRVYKQAANNTGNSTYTYPDNVSAVTTGNVFYRIRQYNKDGKEYVTNVVSIKLNGKLDIKSWPNPFSTSINLTLFSTSKQKLQLALMDVVGKTYLTRTIETEIGNNTLVLSNLANLPAGMYILKVTGTNVNVTEKVVKQ